MNLSRNLHFGKVDAAGLAACALITGIGYAVIVLPLARAQAMHLDQRAELSARQEKVTRTNNAVNALTKDLARIRKATLEHPFELQTVQHSNQRLADLTRLAADHKLDLHELRTGNSSSVNRFEVVPIYLVGKGTYQTCTAFLHQLREAFPDTGVMSLELSDNPSDPSTKTAFKFELSWYAAPIVTAAHKE